MTKSKLANIFFCALLALGLAFPPDLQAQTIANPTPPAMLQDLNAVISAAITATISLFAFISLSFLVIGGYKYLAAGADKAQTEQARNTIIYSLAGLIITLSAFVILNLIGSFLGINLGLFDICISRGVGCT